VKKNTKKFITSVVALSMAFTSVVSTSSLVSASSELTAETDEIVSESSVLLIANNAATRYASGDLPGFTFDTNTEDNVKTSIWNFVSTVAKADDNVKIGIVDGTGDELDGIVLTGSGNKAWNKDNNFALSTTMGFKVPISSNCTGGTITFTVMNTNTDRYLTVNGNADVKVAYNKSAPQVFTFTASDVSDGYISFLNGGNGDYKINKIVLVENLSSDSTTDTTTTEATTEATTKATTEATTEATTKATTEATTKATTEATTEATTTAVDTTTETTTASSTSGGGASSDGTTKEVSLASWDFSSNLASFTEINGTVGTVESNNVKLYVDATSGKLSPHGNSAQFNANTSIYVPVKLGDKVKVVPFEAKYGNYTVGGVSGAVEEGVTVTATAENMVALPDSLSSLLDAETGYIEIKASAASYVKSIELLEEQTTYEGKLTSSEDVVTTKGEEFTVKFAYEGAKINNFTGFIEFNPNLVTLKSGILTNDVSESSSLNNDITYQPDNSVHGYEYLDDYAEGETKKTEAELGKVKVANIFGGADTTEVSKFEITLTFEAKETTDSTNVSFIPFGSFKYGNTEIIDLGETNKGVSTAVTVKSEDDVQVGKYGIKVSGTGITGTESPYTLAESADTFDVTITAAQALSVASATAYLDFDSKYVVVDSVVEGSELFPVAVINDAVNLTPKATNGDFTGMGADGTKKAGELGRIKLANMLYNESDELYQISLAADTPVAVIRFKKVSGTGDESANISFTNIETSDIDGKAVVAADEAVSLAVKIEGEVKTEQPENPENPDNPPSETTTKVAHLLGDLTHDGIIATDDAAVAYDFAKNVDTAKGDYEKNIGDVFESDTTKHIVDATDAAALYDKVKNNDMKFDKRQTGIVKTDGSKQYVEIGSDSGDSADCAAIVTISE
jgi:c-di-GMP-binding flagellar brake protein YcgR